MTTILIKRAKQSGSICSVEAAGHSGYAEMGSDIVCEAISAVVQTAIIGLIELIGLNIGYEINKEDGELYFVVESDLEPQKREKADVILETMLLGLYGLSELYPDNLKIKERRCS